MILRNVATVSERHAPPSHANTQLGERASPKLLPQLLKSSCLNPLLCAACHI